MSLESLLNLPFIYSYLNRNKRLMGHIAHLRKQLKTINTYDYIITLIKRRKKTLLTLSYLFFFFHLKKLESPSLQDALCQDWLKLAQQFWRREFFNFVDAFSLFCNYLPLEKGRAIHLNKLESPGDQKSSLKLSAQVS